MKPIETDDDRLAGLLGRLREDDARGEPPVYLRAAVLAAWDAAPSRSSSHAVLRSAAALAAGVVLVASLARLGSDLRSGVAVPPLQTATTTVHLVGDAFAEGEAVRVVRMRLAPAMLASLGIRSTAGDLAESVDVDVIVGEDGVARAIRVGM